MGHFFRNEVFIATVVGKIIPNADLSEKKLD
jgi:hypothetical protein